MVVETYCFCWVRPPPPPLVSALTRKPLLGLFIIYKYLQYAYWPLGICLVIFFFGFSSFFNKIQDGRQNPMAHARAWTASSICFMFGLMERPYSGCELKSFWCDSDNKNYDFFTLQNFSGFFCFVYFDYHQNLLISYTPLLRVFLNICSMHIGPKELPDNFFAFFSFFSKIQDGRQNPMSLSRAWTAS